MANRFGNVALRKLADKSEQSREVMWYVPPGSFEPQEDGGVVITSAAVVQQRLVNPDTPGYEHEAWPLAGVTFEEMPKRAKLPYSWVQGLVAEGHAKLIGERVVHRAGGPTSNPWATTHTFIQADAIEFDTVDGKVRYDVVENPDKYESARSESAAGPELAGKGGDDGPAIFWSYHVKLADG